ncbi:hypothetical protein GMSM_35250 [Geomonas sp. Red276]
MQHTLSIRSIGRAAAGVLALGALLAVSQPQEAAASTTANTKLLNVVTVSYKDASNNNTFSANASTQVTVNLVKAGLNAISAPTSSVGGLSCLAPVNTPSGGTITTLYAMVANANGSDTYNFGLTATSGTNTNGALATNVTSHFQFLKYDGSTDGAQDTGTHVFASGIGVGVATGSSDTILFPGGSLDSNTFAPNKIVVVTYLDGKKQAFLVSNVAGGSAASINGNNAGGAYSTVASTTGETQGQLKLAALPTTSIDGINVGANAAPDFDTHAVDFSVPIAELALVQVSVTASVAQTNTDATVNFTLTGSTQGPGPQSAAITCTDGTWVAPQLTISKLVRNVSKGGTFVGNLGTANADPSDTLEYQVTVTNAGGDANKVVVTDAVPAYTTLVAGNTYGTAGTPTSSSIFAQVTKNGGTAINIDMGTSAVESPNVAGGDAGGVAAKSPLNFYLGDTNSTSTGGTVKAGETFVIIYQVKVN